MKQRRVDTKEQAREDVLEALESNNVEGFEGECNTLGSDGKFGQSQLSSDEEEDEVDSDQELQIALESGLLKPGLNVELPALEKSIYEKDTLIKLGDSLKEQNLEWLERMDVTCEPMDSAKCIPNQQILDTIESNDLVNDDFRRELVFFRQAQAAIAIALPKLKQHGIPTERPHDYFAEMAKSDDHMKKVRERLLAKTKTAERIEKIRKQREAKKFGKKVQIEKELEKVAEKKKIVDKVEMVKKGRSKDLSFLNDDNPAAANVSDTVLNAKDLKKSGSGGGAVGKNKPGVGKKVNKLREAKNKRYGHGGKRRNMKRNDKKSSSSLVDTSRGSGSGKGSRGSFGAKKSSPSAMKKSGGGRGGGGGSKSGNNRRK